MKIYVIIFNWSTDEDSDVVIDTYVSYESAKKAFLTVIKDETSPGVNWANDAFNENGELDCDRYDLVTNGPFDDDKERELYWCLSDRYSANVSEIYLKICEPKK